MMRACVIGWPIAHSRSPLIHNYWLKRHGIGGEYTRQPVGPDDLKRFITALPENGYVGCNVTLPYKEAVFDLVTPADEATRALHAVNTVFLREGRLWGTNTDGEGFLANIKSAEPSWSPAGNSVIILGAGGSARAIVAELIAEKIGCITVVNRSIPRIAQIQEDFGTDIKGLAWESLTANLTSCDLLVNSTSLGMTGQPPLTVDLSALPSTALVADIVYTPLETDFLKQARARGHRVIPGLGMLLHQAVRGFELWFGVRPAVTPELYDLVAADIAGTRP
ncbi:shikimate dehydrogenase [soil metagenome]